MTRRDSPEHGKKPDQLEPELEDFVARLDWQAARNDPQPQRGTGQPEGAVRPDCPPPQELAALAAGESVANREALIEHVLDCAGCRLEVQAALAGRDFVAKELGASEAQRPDHPNRWSVATSRWLPAAAVVLVALALAVWFAVGRGIAPVPANHPPTVRSGTDLTELEPTDRARLERFPERFSWPSQAGATGYRVRVFSAAAAPLWESPITTESTVELPPDLPESLAEPGTYGWEVTVEGPAAVEVLGTFWFEVDG